MKKIYIQDHRGEIGYTGAGHWIYNGYKKAWECLGYETKYLSGLPDEIDEIYQLALEGHEYRMMLTDSFYSQLRKAAVSRFNMDDEVKVIVKKCDAIYLFAQPNNFPMPWGSHPNFKCLCAPELIEESNSLDNIKLWSFANINREYFPLWKHIDTVPLAFDNISYEYLEDEKYKFDVCFVGGRANNGFDEKYSIMMKHFLAFKDSGLKCGFFVGKNLTHEQENKILFNSKVSINIHDAYQRKLGLDTNERTFKSLGLTGVLVSDKIGQVNNLFPDVKTTNDAKEMVKFVKEYVNMPEKELQKIKTENRKLILEKHTYTNRVKQLLDL